MFVSVGDRPLLFDEPVHGPTGAIELKEQLMRSALQEFEPTLRHHQQPRSAASLWNVHALVSMEGVIFEEFSFGKGAPSFSPDPIGLRAMDHVTNR
jgi:hypothetical protein